MSTRSKWLVSACLAIYTAIVMLPPFIYKYIYPVSGDDSATHMNFIKHANLLHQLYFGYVVCYPMKWISSFISINTSFFWFNFIVLVGVGYSIYFVLSKLVNWKAGLFGLALILIANGIWTEYYYGEIFNVLNMGILLPFLIYFVVKWIEQRKIYQLVLMFVLGISFALCHTSGVYLFPTVLVLLVSYIGYSIFKKQKVDKKLIIMGVILFIVSSLCAFWLYEKTIAEWSWVFQSSGRLSSSYMLQVLSPITIALLALALFYQAKINNLTMKILLAIGFVLLGAVILSPHSDKQFYDFVTVVSLITACLISAINKKMAQYAIIILVVAGIGFNIQNWVGYHSAVKIPDKEAIEYLNTLNVQTYSCNEDTENAIYSNYIKEQYVAIGGDVLIVRNEPQTMNSTPSSSAYIPHGTDSTQGYTLKKIFSDNKIDVEIYTK
jgi:hypothetical protein